MNTRKQQLAQELQISAEEIIKQTERRTPTLGRFGKLWIQYMLQNYPLTVMELQMTDRFYQTALKKEQKAQEMVQDILEVYRKEAQGNLPLDMIERTQLENQWRMAAEETAQEQMLVPFS